MQISILSGKGGAGKTFVATNLAASLDNANYIDCDIEEPNGYLFFQPIIEEEKEVRVELPKINKEICRSCRKCVEFCKFNALGFIKDKPILFEDLCHSCMGCKVLCPSQAIESASRQIGQIQIGRSEDTKLITGLLNVGEASGTQIINQMLTGLDKQKNSIIDCPPGSACNVMDSIKDADYCILVAEPSLFGLDNFKMVEELVRVLNKPFGIVINKSFEENNLIQRYAQEKNIEVLLDIPYSEEIFRANSNGLLISRNNQSYKKIFIDLFEKIEGAVKK